MSADNWGHCKNCSHFASPARLPLEDEEARCEHPELAKFSLTVFGACGCTGFDLRAGFSPYTEQPSAPPS
jgi:hypothetical protein